MAARSLALTGLALALSAFAVDAQAQNLDAGKSAGQLFSANCTACHRSVKGLSKTPNVGQVAGFLRQHYTTNKEMAASLAGYVVSAGVDPNGRRAREAAQDAAKPEPRQRQAARTEGATDATPPAAAATAPQTREERAAARKAKLEEAAKRAERAAKRDGNPEFRSDPPPVTISQAPVPLAHERASSRADVTRQFPRGVPASPAQASTSPATRTAAVARPVPEAPNPAMNPAAPPPRNPPPEAVPSAAMRSEPVSSGPTEPAAIEPTSLHPAEAAASASVQPFSAPLP